MWVDGGGIEGSNHFCKKKKYYISPYTWVGRCDENVTTIRSTLVSANRYVKTKHACSSNTCLSIVEG